MAGQAHLDVSKTKIKNSQIEADELTEDRTELIRSITKKYIEAFDNLFVVAGKTCEVPDRIHAISREAKLENVEVYLQKLVYKYYCLLDDDLKTLSHKLGRLALNHQEFKSDADNVITKFENIDDLDFRDKKFIKKEDVLEKRFAALDQHADKILEDIKKSKKGDSKSNQKAKTAGEAGNSGKKPAVSSFEVASKGEKDRKKNELGNFPGAEAGKGDQLQEVDQHKPAKISQTTVTVISKHHPRANVMNAYRWRPNHSLLKSRNQRKKDAQKKELEKFNLADSEREESKRGSISKISLYSEE